jgi:hypothetical protein
MAKVTVHVNLYGSLSRFGGGKYVAQMDTELEYGACKTDLLEHLGIPEEEKGYVFINSVLHDVPGLTTESGQVLQDGDYIGIFSVDRLWPYQYRDGVRMSEALTERLRQHGAMHHSYS